MTDQEAQQEYDEAMKIMEEVANSNNPVIAFSRTVRIVPNLMALICYLLQEVKQLRAEVERLQTPQRTQYGGQQ